ncbi:MAG TPA: sulfate ABC transporter permease subunit CysW, partial [Thermoanaerobaculia bacterium]|nr:sulfate ABC transporter permease subunit CysW [Thermoanaerobaculia bacterium]
MRPRRSPAAPLLILAAVAFLALMVLAPLTVVFFEAFRRGIEPYLSAVAEPDALAAVRLTLTVAAISVPLNAVFGLAAAWAVAKFEFKGKSLLLTLIDLPFSLSPVIAGLVWVLLFGAQGWFGQMLRDQGVQIVFTTSGLVLATILVTLPYVARELIPFMSERGN